MLELAALESEAGDGAAAEAAVEAAASLRCADRAGAAAAARRLGASGLPGAALAAHLLAYRAGHRAPEDVIALDALIGEEAGMRDGPLAESAVIAMLAGHAGLVAGQDRTALLAAMTAREASPAWVGRDDLAGVLRDVVRAGEPFSWIRLGDGEARFLLHARPTLRRGIEARAVRATTRVIWSIWFGQDLDAADPGRIADMADRLDVAIARADLLGTASAARVIHDPDHAGYCGVLEAYVAALTSDSRSRHFTESLFNYSINEADPFLTNILGGIDYLGVIAPYPDLAERLARQLKVAHSETWLIPGEARDGAPRAGERHFPDVFDRIMADLALPHPGAVVLVAGGLLGKIYCDRVRQLGGVALDIGALADAWMGRNTRGSSLDKSMAWVLPPA